MKFHYTHEGLYDYNFLTLGAELQADRTVELNDAQYRRFCAETENTTHRLTLVKEPQWTKK